MKPIPDTAHLQIEACLRGVCDLLPAEGFDGWQVKESSKRRLTTKLLRMTRFGKPRLALERLGVPINAWIPYEIIDRSKLPTTNIIERERGHTLNGLPAVGKNPGFHSNVFGFFGKPEKLWLLRLDRPETVWKLLEVLS